MSVNQVDFEQEDGSHVRNIISDGPSGGLDDLNMTYTFEFSLDNIQEGSPEAEKELQRLKGVSFLPISKCFDCQGCDEEVI